MVPKALTLIIILCVLWAAVGLWWNPPPPKPHKIEVGKSLAMARMRRLGVEGNWKDYVTPGLTGV
jgi:hypothetical protein